MTALAYIIRQQRQIDAEQGKHQGTEQIAPQQKERETAVFKKGTQTADGQGSSKCSECQWCEIVKIHKIAAYEK